MIIALAVCSNGRDFDDENAVFSRYEHNCLVCISRI
jgi:hypothetical protein